MADQYVTRNKEDKELLADHIGDLYERQDTQQALLDQMNAQLRQMLESGQTDTSSGVTSAIASFFTAEIGSGSTIAVESKNNVRSFYRLVRDWVVKVQPWSAAIRYQTLPDENWDLTLVSQRVYGNRHEFITVLAAAGLDTVEQELEEQLLTLPSPSTLEILKRQAGYISRPGLRA